MKGRKGEYEREGERARERKIERIADRKGIKVERNQDRWLRKGRKRANNRG